MGVCALEKDPPSLPLWSTPPVHPNYAPAHMKAELLDEKSPPVTSPVEMLFWIHVQPGWSTVYQKGVITATEICIELTLFNSEALKDEWECGSGPESKDEISGQETTSTISFWIKAGVCVAPSSNTRYMNALLWGDRSLQTLRKWWLLVKLLLFAEWKEPILSPTYIIWSASF